MTAEEYTRKRLTISVPAVHLNVDPGASHSRLFWRKCLWVVIGLFAPEIVLVRDLALTFSRLICSDVD